MVSSSHPRGRRAILGGLAALALEPLRAAARGRPVVTLLGDSITAGYGLQAKDALPAQLQAALLRLGVGASVRGAGVSGDTTAGGLGRVDFSVQADTTLCVVELGGNDLLQGLDPRTTQANLQRIVARLKARRIKVVLCGLRAPESLNRGFALQFNAVFAAVARAERVPLYPDLLAGVELSQGLNQRDGIHPNARGVKLIASRLAPVVARTLETRA
jgi:acyl-CoA thioesterase-1